MDLPISTARRLILHCQGLDGRWQLPAGREGAARTVERLGHVQIDSIAVVQRAHHHTLWTRQPDYTPEDLHGIFAHDRQVFEGWLHAASYMPLRHYRYTLPRMRAWRARAREWFDEHAQLVEGVLARIRAEGPLGSADFEPPEGWERGTWWSWKPAKEALEMLLSAGDLMVSERRSFQRVYDLRERVLPDWVDTTEPDADEVTRFRIRRTLGAMGIGSENEIQWRQGIKPAVTAALEEMAGAGEIVPVEVDGWEGKPCYALAETLDRAEAAPAGERDDGPLHVLSPFDNLVTCRPWLEQLFGFAYRIECFTPAARRRYGYFALPVLWGERFVARVDAKAERKSKTLILHQLAFEPRAADLAGLLPALAEQLWAFAAFNACERITVERVEPGKAKAALERELGQQASQRREFTTKAQRHKGHEEKSHRRER